MSTTSQKEKLRTLISKREKYFERVQKLYDACRSVTTSNLNSFLVRYERIDEYYNSFDKIQDDITALCHSMDPSDAVETKESSDSFEDLYFQVKAFVRQQSLSSQPQAPPAVAPSTTVKPRLPKLEIPNFHGDLKDWSNFHSLFRSTIHCRSDINEVEKLQYLRSFLRGPPLTLIENLQIVPGSYDITYRLLCNRYDNKRTLAAHYLKNVFNFKQLTSDNAVGLRTFLDTFQTNVAALKNLGIPDLGDFLLLQLALRALNVEVKKLFEDKQSDTVIPKFDDLINFINQQTIVNDLIQSSSNKQPPSRTSNFHPLAKNSAQYKPSQISRVNNTYLSTIDSPSNVEARSTSFLSPHRDCPMCSQNHYISKCPTFLKLKIDEKIEAVKAHHRCFNCLGNHHKKECQSSSRCQKCKKPHHTLIHTDSSSSSNQANVDYSSTSASKNVSCHLSTHDRLDHSTVMLGTARAMILDCAGSLQPVRVVVDPGSQISCITDDCVRRLGLRRFKCGISMSGIGDNSVPNNKGAVRCAVATTSQVIISHDVQAVVLSRIATLMPSVPISRDVINRFSHLNLADPDFHVPSCVDFLIGAELYCNILSMSSNTVLPGEPTAVNTCLGWLLLGRATTAAPNISTQSFLVQTPSLNTIMQRFWEAEEVKSTIPADPEDIKCEEHFQKTHYRTTSGRYVLALPFHSEPALLGSNRQSALRQFNSLKTRFNKNPALKKEYSEFFDDYCSQDHMSPASSPFSYVIPHHAVVKTASSTTKVRAVFNASASTADGRSLNSLLMKGPKMQHDICDIVLSFRKHRVVVCADIRQMYRQILVRPEDRTYQHIFWHNKCSDHPVEYELNTVTYGLTPSAFQAQRVLKQLVQDEGSSFPLASSAILHETYIDDILSGADNVSQALQLKDELIALLQTGGFELRKWASNSREILETVPFEHCEVPLRQNEESTFKILGFHWQSETDSFAYYVAATDSVSTKRTILSQVARMFDPLGWLSPVIFWAKHLLQELWLSNLSWDDDLPSELREQWQLFSSQLHSLERIKIPRFIEIPPDGVHIVGFCDASSKGYAAGIYLVIPGDINQSILIKGKSKVAPTKQVLSIPRLELCGALLLTRVYNSIQGFLNKFNIRSVAFFSDSNIVLAWLRTPPHLLQTYVANRVVEINQSMENICSWYHVSSSENPCDCASRGLLPHQLASHDLWWHGPSFLSMPKFRWPSGQGHKIDNVPELKKVSHSLIVAESVTPINDLREVTQKFSKLIKLHRVFAYIRRFIHNVRRPTVKLSGPLQVEELNSSLHLIIKLEQFFHYKHVIRSLQNKSSVKDHGLAKLSPFLDGDGLLRVGGRLRKSDLSYECKHPLLLPKISHLSNLICDHYHQQSLHAGPRTVQALIQQRYWIISLRGLLRQRLFKCLNCYRYKAKPSQPLMADLPRTRVARDRPFLNVGVDLGGPFYVKESSRRNARAQKSYLCLFVCFSTKAVHLELVSDMTSASFLAALDRFVGRRGLPQVIHSDNGTNFVASARELKEAYELLRTNFSTISETLALRQLKWVFNPPAASNFGGLWEAAIKSAKHHLRRVIGGQLLTFEERSTLLCRVEAVLNSRPLIDVSPDPSDEVDYLSPGHFLIGTSLLSTPEPDFTTAPINGLSRWRLIQQASQSFWNLWSTSYLQSLTARTKWSTSSTPLKSGDLVLLPNLHKLPLHWPIGRIDSVHPGDDGVVQVVTVKTGNSTLTRPVNKIIPFPS